MTILAAPDAGSVSAVLGQNFGVCTALTTWSNALLNTNLYPLDPKPSWFDTLSAQLKPALAAAQQWVDSDGPAVLAEAPQIFIDFGNLFAAAAPDMVTAMTAIAGAQGHAITADQLALLSGSITTLLQDAQEQQQTAVSLQTKVKAFADTIRAQHDALLITIGQAEATLTADDTAVADLQSRIASLQSTLGINSEDAAKNGQGALASSLSLFGTLFIFGVATIATGGAAAPLLGIAVATVTVSYDASQQASEDKSAQANYTALGLAQVQLTDEQAQAAALRSIIRTLEGLLDCNSAVAYATDILVPVWNDLVARLEFISELLQQPTIDLTLVSALTSLAQAGENWASIVATATNVQGSILNMTEPIHLSA